MCSHEIRERIREQNQFERRVLDGFEAALRSADLQAIGDSFGTIEGVYFGWKRAFRRAAKLDALPANVRSAFLRIWVHHGDHIRSEVNDDLVLIRGLRRLLPTYRGARPLTLYRGESVYNWKRRTYGLAWSGKSDVAHGFAEKGLYRTFEGGSVLLKVVAPPQNIICTVTPRYDRYTEQEYLVDRRGLKGVTAVQRYHQLEYSALIADNAEPVTASLPLREPRQ
jgi:hypothetical protein